MNLKANNNNNNMKPELAKYGRSPLTKRNEHLIDTTQTSTEKNREGGHSKKKKQKQGPQKSYFRHALPRLSKKTPPHTTPPTFLELDGLNAQKKKHGEYSSGVTYGFDTTSYLVTTSVAQCYL